ncbi:MAG: hypothetical protein FD173_966 [Gallionellaceae bacterium]|nr:MAG: hypothetical protein FD173_966 [Gallionellaceae bacterium]
MFVNPIPWQGRVLAVLLLTLAGIAFGLVAGLHYESNSRDAQELKTARSGEERFMKALANGRTHATNEIEWRNKARIYYRNWQERLKHAPDNQLAECSQPLKSAPATATTVLLSGVWLSLYNAAWIPDFDQQGDSGGAAGEVVEAGAVTPREALDNIRLNAELCGADRKRLDELIDHLNEVEAMP